MKEIQEKYRRHCQAALLRRNFLRRMTRSQSRDFRVCRLYCARNRPSGHDSKFRGSGFPWENITLFHLISLSAAHSYCVIIVTFIMKYRLIYFIWGIYNDMLWNSWMPLMLNLRLSAWWPLHRPAAAMIPMHSKSVIYIRTAAKYIAYLLTVVKMCRQNFIKAGYNKTTC